MGVTNKQSESLHLIVEKGNFKDKDGNTFDCLENVELMKFDTTETKIGKMHRLHFKDLDTGQTDPEKIIVWTPEQYFCDFGARVLNTDKITFGEVRVMEIDGKTSSDKEVSRRYLIPYAPGKIEALKDLPKWNVRDGKLIDRNEQVNFITENLSKKLPMTDF